MPQFSGSWGHFKELIKHPIALYFPCRRIPEQRHQFEPSSHLVPAPAGLDHHCGHVLPLLKHLERYQGLNLVQVISGPHDQILIMLIDVNPLFLLVLAIERNLFLHFPDLLLYNGLASCLLFLPLLVSLHF